mmetsp:Transcript_25639/g.24940  ORF Transcript_25639/g.24940 Transcript_25639/m.24940 type:complete len:173 (+) Transcript_25639:244-762(+)
MQELDMFEDVWDYKRNTKLGMNPGKNLVDLNDFVKEIYFKKMRMGNSNKSGKSQSSKNKQNAMEEWGALSFQGSQSRIHDSQDPNLNNMDGNDSVAGEYQNKNKILIEEVEKMFEGYTGAFSHEEFMVQKVKRDLSKKSGNSKELADQNSHGDQPEIDFDVTQRPLMGSKLS